MVSREVDNNTVLMPLLLVNMGAKILFNNSVKSKEQSYAELSMTLFYRELLAKFKEIAN